MATTTMVMAAALCVGLCLWARASAQQAGGGEWNLYVTNDNCPDYTWGYSEKRTRRAAGYTQGGQLLR